MNNKKNDWNGKKHRIHVDKSLDFRQPNTKHSSIAIWTNRIPLSKMSVKPPESGKKTNNDEKCMPKSAITRISLICALS